MMLQRLRNSETGASIVEFAIGAPILLAFIYGLAQLGILAVAKTGLQHAVAEASRVAAVFPRPSNTVIQNAANAARFGLDPDRLTTPEVIPSVEGGTNYVTVRLRYTAKIEFLFLPSRTVTLQEERKVAVH
jgi:Flp pilus assembly protein TadG